MVLLDTSIWVDSMQTKHIGLAFHVRELLRADTAAAHEFVYGELMLGKGGKTRAEVIDLYARVKRLETSSHDYVVAFVKKHKLDGRGIGWIDCHLLAAAHSGFAKLWTSDKALRAAASEVGVEYTAYVTEKA